MRGTDRRNIRDREHLLDNPYRLLARVEQRAPQVITDLIGAPQFGAWGNDVLHRLLTTSGTGDAGALEADLSRLALFAATAAIEAAEPFDLAVPLGAGIVSFPTLGALHLADAPWWGWTRVWQASAGRPGEWDVQQGPVTVRVLSPAARTRSWVPLPRVTVREHGLLLDVLLDSQDPFLDRYGAAPRLWAVGPEEDRWRDMLAAGWTVLASGHPELAALVAETVRTVVPLASPALGGSASATEETSFGAIALALPADEMAMAAALVHETHHAILGALTDLEPLVRPDDPGFLGRVPWRDDPRPAHALLHGIYAHHGIGRFWHHQYLAGPDLYRERAARQFGRLRGMLALAIPVLRESGQLTEAGQDLLAPIAADVAQWLDESLPGQVTRTSARYRR
jgi:HEXXH motif-containing protein